MTMKRPVALLLVASVLALLAACGGGAGAARPAVQQAAPPTIMAPSAARATPSAIPTVIVPTDATATPPSATPGAGQTEQAVVFCSAYEHAIAQGHKEAAAFVAAWLLALPADNIEAWTRVRDEGITVVRFALLAGIKELETGTRPAAWDASHSACHRWPVPLSLRPAPRVP